MPISVIWKLQLPRRQRRTLMLLLSLSLFACIAGVIRNVYLGYSLPSYDLLWTSWQYSIAAIVEVDLGVVGTIFSGNMFHVSTCDCLIH